MSGEWWIHNAHKITYLCLFNLWCEQQPTAARIRPHLRNTVMWKVPFIHRFFFGQQIFFLSIGELFSISVSFLFSIYLFSFPLSLPTFYLFIIIWRSRSTSILPVTHTHTLTHSLTCSIYRSLETLQIPFETDDLAILICNSNVRHELSHSEYPTRRKQCAKALELMGLQSYKDATIKTLDGSYCHICRCNSE